MASVRCLLRMQYLNERHNMPQYTTPNISTRPDLTLISSFRKVTITTILRKNITLIVILTLIPMTLVKKEFTKLLEQSCRK